MKTLNYSSTTRWAAYLSLVLSLTCASADTVKTRDGKVYEGTILSEDATTVTIKYKLSGNLTDTKTISKLETTSVVKLSPEQAEVAELKKLLPTPDMLNASEYRKMIERGPAKFLAANPLSKLAPEVEKVKKELEAERIKAQQGMRKVDGKWITGEEAQANEYNLNTYIALKDMEKLAADPDKYREALLAFNEIEKNSRYSIHFPTAIEKGMGVIDLYIEQLGNMSKLVPAKKAEKEEELKTLNPDQKQAALVEIKRRDQELKAQIAQEKKEKVPFTTVVDTELSTITEALKQLDAAKKRLSALDLAQIKTTAAAYDAVLKLVGQAKFEEADDKLEAFVKNEKTAATDKVISAKVTEIKSLVAAAKRDSQARKFEVQKPQSTTPEAAPATN
jgi:hypothetical protein